ncbi:MAG: response regulator [Candidatus Sigynarchaeota archaeon]
MVRILEKAFSIGEIQAESRQFRCSSNKNTARVLVVDDDEAIRETMGDIFREMGIHTTLARDGFEAIEMVKRAPPDLIIMDLRMPGIDGLQTSKEILSFRPGARIIIVSAYMTSETFTDARHAGVIAVFEQTTRYRNVKGIYHVIEIILRSVYEKIDR